MKKIFYVYVLIDPKSKKPFYIGKGKDNRMYYHEKSVKLNKIPNNNSHLYYKINSIISENRQIIYKKLYENLTEIEAWEKEIYEINKIGIDKLCNLTKGGKGGVPTDEVREKISKRFKGKPKSKETILKIKKSLREKYKDMTIEEKKKRFGNNKGKSTWNLNKKYSVKSKSDRINEKFGKKICDLYKKGYSFSSIAREISLKGEKISYQIVKTVLKMNDLYDGNIVKKIGEN